MSNSLDPDQARRFVRPDLGPNCLPKISADDTGRQRVKPVHEILRDYHMGCLVIACSINPRPQYHACESRVDTTDNAQSCML